MNAEDKAFYEDRCPALKDPQWEWYDHQSFLNHRAGLLLGYIPFGNRKALIDVYYRNNGTRCWFVLSLRIESYPQYSNSQDLNIDAYKATAEELRAAAIAPANTFLVECMPEIDARVKEAEAEELQMQAMYDARHGAK